MGKANKFKVAAGILVIAVGGLAATAVAQQAAPNLPTQTHGGLGSDGIRDFLGLGPKPNLVQALRGAPIYGANCGGCHGDDARGGSASNLMYSDLVKEDVGGSNIAAIIRNGKGSMPAIKNLSDQQVADISMYLDQLYEDIVNRGTYSFAAPEKILVGNPTAGKAFFDGNCASCHTPDAIRATGIAKKPPEEIQGGWVGARGPAQVVSVTQGSGQSVTGSLVRKSDFDIIVRVNNVNQTLPIDDNTKVVVVEDKMKVHHDMAWRLTNTQMHDVTAYLETLK